MGINFYLTNTPAAGTTVYIGSVNALTEFPTWTSGNTTGASCSAENQPLGRATYLAVIIYRETAWAGQALARSWSSRAVN
jgi:hypothetical protein